MKPTSPFARLANQEQAFPSGPAARANASRLPPEGHQESAQPALVEIVGVVDEVRIFGANWGIGVVWTEDRREQKITGSAVATLKQGAEYRMRGRMKQHPKYGQSLEVATAEPHVKLNERAIEKFIAANFKGIGEKSAKKHVQAVLEEGGMEALEAFRVRLLTAPWDVAAEIEAKTNRKSSYGKEERDTAIRAFVERDLYTRLSGLHGLQDKVIKQLAAFVAGKLPKETSDPVAQSWALLARDPYEPIASVMGYGFTTADAIGKSVNIPRNAPQRLSALVAHAVSQHCETFGHAFIEIDKVHQVIARIDPDVDAEQAIAMALENKTVAIEGDKLYPFDLLKYEQRLARQVAKLIEPAHPLSDLSVAGLAQKFQDTAKGLGGAFKDGLDESQLRALVRLASARVRIHTLTAGPGCGKTAVMEVLSQALKGKQFVFCAPTGKGAKVLHNRLSRHRLGAATIHSTLQGEGPGNFKHDTKNPLSGDVLVVDESSMPDLGLMCSVLEAANKDMHVILLGDPGQLPSIGPGQILKDLLKIQEIDHNRLTKTHRNSGGILEVVEEVRRGELVPRDRESVWFSGGLDGAEHDFPAVQAAYLDAVGRCGIENVCLLMSRKKGDSEEPGWNSTFANAKLRNFVNPNAERIPGTRMHVGDRIIIRSNMELAQKQPAGAKGDPPTERVVNGDTGSISGFERDTSDARAAGAKWLRLKLDDGRSIDYPASEASALDHAYCLTVHSAQGSEYQEVIAVMTPGAPTFINRNMMFTAFSRARLALRVFGKDTDLRRIAATPSPERNSALVNRTLGRMEVQETEEDADEEVASADEDCSHRPR
jgi:exodeoxyribonuclease V alpha subunit